MGGDMQALDREAVVYPDSDGERMAENTLQFNWIVMLKENLDAVLPDFVGGDLLWYPVEGRPDIRRAPDVLVALGRPKGDRGSYRQFEEDGVAPQVVMEVLSPKNTAMEMLEKAAFYFRYGAKEFYVIDPDTEQLQVWLNEGEGPHGVVIDGSFTSPALGITFECGDTLVVRHVDGQPFRTLAEERDRVAEAQARVAEAQARAARLEARLRALGVDPDRD